MNNDLKRRRLQSILLLLLILAPPAAYADTAIGKGCNLLTLGATDKESFLAFDQELRAALSKQDKAALALLVNFPLRINHPDGSATTLSNARALQTRFDEAFPPAVRSSILDQKLETIFCKYTGIMYGRGRVWIHLIGKDASQRYRIATVNLPADDSERAAHDEPSLDFVCDAETQRIVVDSLPGEKLRYRSWNKPNLLAHKPNIEASSGTARLEGTGPCSHTLWTFKTGDMEVTVSELGCTEGSPPPGVTGKLEVSGTGTEQTWWCY